MDSIMCSLIEEFWKAMISDSTLFWWETWARICRKTRSSRRLESRSCAHSARRPPCVSSPLR